MEDREGERYVVTISYHNGPGKHIYDYLAISLVSGSFYFHYYIFFICYLIKKI